MARGPTFRLVSHHTTTTTTAKKIATTASIGVKGKRTLGLIILLLNCLEEGFNGALDSRTSPLQLNLCNPSSDSLQRSQIQPSFLNLKLYEEVDSLKRSCSSNWLWKLLLFVLFL